MSASLALFAILGALLVGAVSPGPSFVLVSRIAAKGSRLDGLAAAAGMGLGGAIFAIFALLGLTVVLTQVRHLYLAFKIVGGLYLVYLGIRIWRGASHPIEAADKAPPCPASLLRSLLIGLVTQLSNPKTALVYAGIFAALLPPSAPLWLRLALPPLVLALEASWYAIVAVVFSAAGPRSVYLRSKSWIDRISGSIIGALGARLVSEAFEGSAPAITALTD